jgi:uncharacterized RDD family membrane protein YckC
MDTPDYSKHSAEQLRQILGRIDAARYPERVAEIEARLAALASLAPDAATPQPTLIAPLWRRLLAFVIDLFLLGLLGMALGALLHTQFAAMGAWGRLVGFVITLLYFGLTQSRLRGGQSAGMHLLGLRVVTRSGEPLGLPAAFARAAIFCLAYFMNGAFIDLGPEHEWLSKAVFILTGVLIFSTYYLLLFNRKTRQSLHDLAVGAHVVHAGPGKLELSIERIWRGHAAVVGVFTTIIAVASVVIPQQFPPSDSVVAMEAARQTISRMPEVERATVRHQSYKTDGKTAHDIKVAAVVDVDLPQPQVLAQRIALAALDRYDVAGETDMLVVSLLSGYDIGIASSMSAVHYPHTPAEWRRGTVKAAGQYLP